MVAVGENILQEAAHVLRSSSPNSTAKIQTIDVSKSEL
jgi:hypothetical protein